MGRSPRPLQRPPSPQYFSPGVRPSPPPSDPLRMTPSRVHRSKPDISTSTQQELRAAVVPSFIPYAAGSPPIYVANGTGPTMELELRKWTEVFSSQPYKCYCQGRRKEEAALQRSVRNKTRAYRTKPRGRSMQRNPPCNTSQQVWRAKE